MARTAARRSETEDEELIETELDDQAKAQAAAPPISDSRRRRQAKRGIVETGASAAVTRKDRPTPSQRAEAPRSRNFVVRFVQNVREYFHEVQVELRKVAWPSREEVNRLTRIVLIVTIASSIFLGAVSFVFGFLTTQIAEGASIATILTLAMVVVVAGLWLFRDRLFGAE
ncbi:MAG: preprotein translocase subunit SecE [Candidatus Thermofonsia Clade 1 bacterium]|jgi:preprotein translocase subunit SecE|uniref:Protein translocase subunit SecE n=1 Tax=Candidatus Thermofonsia Clade 1 bacterium TaxID=2364210 RepID=A0A2M8PX83_9CHLR|nr:MAG: preprotein translocase subunit SecE [Candidatus Thermofonsia Clade 1 bacterium]PJF42155.1 MAG: preprotein translocase subunit SecE [Candidatus Thermofonsia Clade 1 bacterium]RMF50077.1 MAG: preprotein translocase subunit SecE [Chloroflexota bacterium]